MPELCSKLYNGIDTYLLLARKRALPGGASGSPDGEPAPERVTVILDPGPNPEEVGSPKGERRFVLPPDEGSFGEVLALAGFDKGWPSPPACAYLPIVKCSGLVVDIIDYAQSELLIRRVRCVSASAVGGTTMLRQRIMRDGGL